MYLTLYRQTQNNHRQIDYTQIMNTNFTDSPAFYKTTYYIEHPKPLSAPQYNKIAQLKTYLEDAYNILKPFKDNYEEQYYEFKIPKRSGGLRTIDAPNEKFKEALSKVKYIFEQKLKCLAHNSAYAYTKQRSVLDALKVHQANKSNWYLKLDLTDFFPSCTPDFIYNQLIQLYPFYYFDKKHKDILKEIVKICCLHGGLPQGTPMSPLLTNLIMVPYDYTISNTLKRGLGEHFVYTRYADDILISCKSDFDWKEIEQTLAVLLKPFEIKHEKTRYGSRAGSNWNLGLMLNKDNNITLGSAKKKLINAMLNNFIRDYNNNIKWSREDTYELQGQLGYLKHIEPTYYNYIVQKYEAKYKIIDYKNLINSILN